MKIKKKDHALNPTPNSLSLHFPSNLVLEINRDTNTLLTEWDAEPVSAIILPTSTFTPNRQGFPVLTKSHQAIVRRFMRHKLQIVVSTEASDDLVGGVENEFPLPSAAGGS